MTNEIDLQSRTRHLPQRAWRTSHRPGSSKWAPSGELWRDQVDYDGTILPVVRAVEFTVRRRVDRVHNHLADELDLEIRWTA